MVELRPLLLDGPRRTGDLVQALGITRAGLLHAYKRESGGVLRFGRARSTRFAARQTLEGLSTDQFPVFRVDTSGKIAPAGEVITLANVQSIWLPSEVVLDGLPPELHDIAPRGFLGRPFARRHAELALPENTSNWSDHHALIAISRRGEDLPGNLVVGRESFDRFQRLTFPTHTVDDFAALAEAALAGEHAGSSAGGEHPKFTTLLEGHHRIVKFAGRDTDNARRWHDLLALEHIALETLSDAGVAAAKTRLIDTGGLRCLIVDRFDRIGVRGRRAVMSLAAATERLTGSWTDAAHSLAERRLLSRDDLDRVALLDAYGASIANTDRHQYNVLLFFESDSYTLAPAFDQLPMAYAPPASGHLRNDAIAEAVPAVNTLAVWDQARELASRFWRRAAEVDLSDSMRKIVAIHARR
jgi:hypothetical protein